MAFLLQLSALVLILAGAVTFPLPIPVGLILMAVGIALLLSTSRTAIRMLRRYRRTRPEFDGWLKRVRLKLPGFLGRPLRRSEPWRFRRRPPDAP